MTAILIIKLGALGDVLRTTCILPGLHEKYPNARISWVTSGEAVCLLKNNPLIDSVFQSSEVTLTVLRKRSYDLTISLDDEITTSKIAATINTKELFGAYRKDGVTQYTRNSSHWFDMSLISTFGKEEADIRKRLNKKSYPDLLFSALGLSPAAPCLHLSQTHCNYASRFALSHLKPGKPVIGLNTGASTRWQYKQLGVEHTVQLIDNLAAACNCQILLYGGPKEETRNKMIIQATSEKLINTGTNNSILQFAALIKLSDVLVTSDSFALHIASALGIPTVAFFGPTSASEIKLFTPGEKIVPDIPCVCCYKKTCDFSPTCMDVLSTEKISQAVQRLLS